MEFLKRSWTQVRVQLEGLTPAQKWLIGALIVIMLLVGFLLMQYAGQAETVTINGFASGRSDEVLARLRARGIDATRDGGQLRVPADKHEEAILLLVEDNLLSDDSSTAFDDLVSKQNPWASSQQNAQAFLVAKQKVLAGIIRKMRGVKAASVMIDMPRDLGFGATHVRPSASVVITSSNGQPAGKAMAEAVAALVSGAVAEMVPNDVKIVIDGRNFRIDDANDIMPSEALALVDQQEQKYRDKIERALQYIDGVIVAVNVRVDPINKKIQKDYQYATSEPLASEQTIERSTRSFNESGEPGPRSNTGLTISGGSNPASEETYTENNSEFRPKELVLDSQTVYAGHTVKQINVTVNVPRGYFLRLFKARNPQTETEPDDTQLQPIVDRQLADIRSQVEPLIAADDEGVVRVHMIPDDSVRLAVAGGTPASTVGVMLQSDWAKPVGVGLLALLSLGLMLGMVRRATRPDTLPSVEELAGVPPSLPSGEELVGEADELETTMAGVELNEGELKSRKIAEQISELIRSNPPEAGSILGRWVRKDD
jgi:flagellar M-ring protein FliF